MLRFPGLCHLKTALFRPEDARLLACSPARCLVDVCVMLNMDTEDGDTGD